MSIKRTLYWNCNMHKQFICLNVAEHTRTRIHLQDPWSITFNIPHQQWQNFNLVRCHYITSQQSHAWKDQSRSGKAAPYIIKQDDLDPVQAEKSAQPLYRLILHKNQQKNRNSPNPATPHPAPSSITRFPLSLDGQNLPFLQFFSWKNKKGL